MLYTIRFLNRKPVCCGDVSLPNDITRAGLESSGNVCMESDTEPEFYTRWVHTPADSPDNVAPKDAFAGVSPSISPTRSTTLCLPRARGRSATGSSPLRTISLRRTIRLVTTDLLRSRPTVRLSVIFRNRRASPVPSLGLISLNVQEGT